MLEEMREVADVLSTWPKQDLITLFCGLGAIILNVLTMLCRWFDI